MGVRCPTPPQGPTGRHLIGAALLAGLAACSGQGDAVAQLLGAAPQKSPVVTPGVAVIDTLGQAPLGAPQGPAANQGVLRGGARASVVVRGLEAPWALAFLPDGGMLVTEKAGQMRRISASGQLLPQPVTGLPPVADAGQGGLLDVVVAPAGGTGAEPWVYWSYAEPGQGPDAGKAGTAVARGKLVGQRLTQVQVIFRQQPKVHGRGHFGSRLVLGPGDTLFVTLGDRQLDDPARPGDQHAQNLRVHLGKVVRIHRDGRTPADNPAWPAGSLPHTWSLGHRNVQGAALHPGTGALWVSEHGPRGGDEINRVRPGANHGWPLRSYGCPYSFAQVEPDCQTGGGAHAPGFAEPQATWLPISTAPSGMAFYTASRHPTWRGQLFVGALAGQVLWRLALDGDRVVAHQALLADLQERIRDVRQGPDGHLYALTDSGKLLRVEPR